MAAMVSFIMMARSAGKGGSAERWFPLVGDHQCLGPDARDLRGRLYGEQAAIGPIAAVSGQPGRRWGGRGVGNGSNAGSVEDSWGPVCTRGGCAEPSPVGDDERMKSENGGCARWGTEIQLPQFRQYRLHGMLARAILSW